MVEKMTLDEFLVMMRDQKNSFRCWITDNTVEQQETYDQLLIYCWFVLKEIPDSEEYRFKPCLVRREDDNDGWYENEGERSRFSEEEIRAKFPTILKQSGEVYNLGPFDRKESEE